MEIIRRLSTKIPDDKMDFRPKEGMRSMRELLQYLSYCGTGIISFWYRTDGSDIKIFYAPITAKAKELKPEQFVATMDKQIELVKKQFEKITDDDLYNKEIEYPWKETGKLGEGIMITSIKWLTAYKMQLFIYLKLCTDQKLVTPDLWRLTDLQPATV